MLELHQVAQHADDLDRAVAFYTDELGGELIARFEPPGPGWEEWMAFVRDTEGNLIGLASRRARPRERSGHRTRFVGSTAATASDASALT